MDTPQIISASQNSLVPTQMKDCITTMYYWLWRGGLVSLAGRVDHTQSLYQTHLEGILKRFHDSLVQGLCLDYSVVICPF